MENNFIIRGVDIQHQDCFAKSFHNEMCLCYCRLQKADNVLTKCKRKMIVIMTAKAYAFPVQGQQLQTIVIELI